MSEDNFVCPHCDSRNKAGAEQCEQCGETIDIIDLVSRHHLRRTAVRLHDQMHASRTMKENEALASKDRMSELLAIEEKRQIELKQRLKKQKEQERQLLILVFGAVALFLLALIIYAIVSTLG